MKSSNHDVLLSTGSESHVINNLTEPKTLIGNKKGRPMTDTNIIIDEVTNTIYDPELDPIEYKKARK
jgi:hypothetical protein